jgi:preprotein translocase subunit SecG
MFILLTIVHVVICLFLIIVVLLQSGKAADLAGAFGGMGSQTAFGPRGAATVLSKATTIAAAMFMVTSLSLSILVSRGSADVDTVLEQVAPRQSTTPTDPNAGQPSVTITPEEGGGAVTVPFPIEGAPTLPGGEAPAGQGSPKGDAQQKAPEGKK